MPRLTRPFALILVTGLAAGLVSLATAVPPTSGENQGKGKTPDVEGARAAVSVPKGMTVDVWAAEPLMANPVSFCFDGKGRVYVAETTRFDKGVPDTRGHMYWLEEDVGSRSVADRLKMYEKHGYGKKERNYVDFDDTVRMVWDSTGKGVADKSTVFSSGYNQLKDGIGAGVLAHKGSVYFTNIPDLYLLKDTKGTGVADEKKSLATGFGVRTQYIGHDMHGLRMGPDGRLYFSIGDRGFNAVTKDGKKLYNPDSGAVLRCDLDGSNMEIVHIGLRNPQEIAFDEYGNLFTYDNNCDSGDRARWVYIVEGGDSGWRCGYQYGDQGGVYHTPAVPQGNRGPWNTEKIWHTQTPDQPAYIVPPLAHFGNGPSGITHYPGIGLDDKYKGHFFACDFTGGAGGSVIWTLSVKPKGAAFEVIKPEPFIRGMLPTDCEFGPDGAFYWSDWVNGWNPPGKGRIFRVTDPEAMKNPAVAEAKALFAEGFTKKSNEDLIKLLDHPHQQVRLEAQWEITGRDGKVVIPLLAKVAKESKNRFARFHAIWALGRLAPKEADLDRGRLPAQDADAIVALFSLTEDTDTEIRAQVVRALGWLETLPQKYLASLAKLLNDSDPPVQALATVPYSKVSQIGVIRKPFEDPVRFGPLFEMLKANADKDVYLRQAAVNAIARMTQNPADLVTLWKGMKGYDTPAVRLGLVLALRKMQADQLSDFLNDEDPRVVAEAARAIYDQELMKPMVELAKLAEKPGLPDAVAFRATAANFKLGQAINAIRVANVAARTSEPDYLRVGALAMLGQWAKPKRLDIITGLTQNLGQRPPEDAVQAIRPVIGKLFIGGDTVRKEAVATTSKLGIQDVAPLMFDLVKNAQQSVNVRVDALLALDALKAKVLGEAVKLAAASSEPKLRGASLLVSAKLDPRLAEKNLPEVLKADSATIIEKQYAFEALGKLPESEAVDKTLKEWLDAYAAGKVPAELQLDLLEATRAHTTKRSKTPSPLKAPLTAIEKKASAALAKDHLATYRESLAGGDAAHGREIFLNNSAVYCQRCHKLDNQGGEVGPALNGIAKEKTREYLLEAIVAPNKQIAKGYESVTLSLEDGRVISGVLRAKDAKQYTIVTPENKVLTIAKEDVASEKPDKSAMPEDLVKKLSKREIRDLVEFLSGLK